MEREEIQRLGRRAFLKRGALILLPAGSLLAAVKEADREAALRVGLLTDTHYADKPPAGNRHYRDSLTKVEEIVERLNASRVPVAVQLGDFIDGAPDVATELRYLETIEAAYARFSGKRHYVLGNHCVFTLTKEEFLANCGARKSYHSFDSGGFHLVILDACFRADGAPYGRKNFQWTDTDIPEAERQWLRKDLAATRLKTIVFVHQRLDVANQFGVKSAAAVRQILEESGKVLAVFQGHNHVNDHKEIGGIHYCTLAAVVEGAGEANNAYGVLEIHKSGLMKLAGFRKQKSYRLPEA